MATREISAVDPYDRKRIKVLDSEMAYVDTGSGDPVVFLHGNPTSSYLWRNVIPHVEGIARCLAPDLIGMGDSGKMPSGTYRYPEHIAYLDAWFKGVGATENLILVCHDWGGALGYNYAYEHQEQVKGIAYMETMVRPRRWSDLPPERVGAFKAFRTPEGERGVLENNIFVEKLLFELGIVRDLTEEEKAVYRAPYLEPGESRRPTLQWPLEIPFDGEPADNAVIVQRYSDWLSTSDLPKLFIIAENGHALAGPPREWARTWPNQTEVSLPGKHFMQEDYPHEMGEAIANFVRNVRA